MNLGFDEADHQYTVDGQPVPSVTQVLEDNQLLPDYSRLDPFYAVRGSAVHEAIAMELYGRLDWASLDEHTRPFVERARRLIEELAIEPRVIEFRWADPLRRYAGTLDIYGDSAVGPLLLDWKAGQHEKAHSIQVAGGYQPLLLAAAEEGAVPVDPDEVRRCRCATVPLKDELPRPVFVDDVDAEIENFRSALRMTHWRRSNGPRRAAA